MTWKTRASKPRKRLRILKEEFFLLAALAGHVPVSLQAVNRYASYDRTGRMHIGVDVYMVKAVRGLAFRNLVVSHGEAKCRAGPLYVEYIKWYAENNHV